MNKIHLLAGVLLLLTMPTVQAEDEMMPYDHYKKAAINDAMQSEVTVNEHFEALIENAKAHPLTGEEEHDALLLESLAESQKAWAAYRDSYCQAEALIEVYPTTSRLYVETLNSCEARLNKERIRYLDGLNAEFEKKEAL